MALLVGNLAGRRRTELDIGRSFTTKFTVTSHRTCHAFKVYPLLPPVYVSSPVTAWLTSRLYASWIGRGTGYLCHLVNGRQSIHPRTVTARKVSPMSSSNPTALQRLRRLDRSSPNFHNQLSNVLFGEEYGRSVPNLRGNDLVSLVDYLNKVCRPISLLRPQLKRVQALDISILLVRLSRNVYANSETYVDQE